MTVWDKVMLDFWKTGALGACPICASRSLSIHPYGGKRHRSYTFRCGNCRAMGHCDGLQRRRTGEKGYAGSMVMNLHQFNTTGDAGLCPRCGGSRISVEAYAGGRLSWFIMCEDCGLTDHIDGLRG